jgi:copper chaperone CopZ
METNHKFAIEGMHCGACVRRVTAALQGIQKVRIESVEVGSATLAFDALQIPAEKIISALAHIGFPAKVAS